MQNLEPKVIDSIATEDEISPAKKFGDFVEGIRVKRGYASRVAGAKAIGMLSSTYGQIVVGTRRGKPNAEQLVQFTDGFKMTPAERAECATLYYAQYANCKYWPDLSIKDEALLKVETLPDFISMRLIQIGKEPGKLGEAIEWRSSQIAMLKNSNVPSHQLDKKIMDGIVSALQLEGDLKERFTQLNADRPSMSAVFSARVAQRYDLDPDKSVKDRDLLACESLGSFLKLAMKRKGITGAELQRQTFDMKDFFYNIFNGDASYRLSTQFIHRLSDILDLSAHGRLHLRQLNEVRKISLLGTGYADPLITSDHIQVTTSVKDCIKAKAVQRGISLLSITQAIHDAGVVDLSHKTIEHLITEGRGTQVSFDLLRVTAEFLEMTEEESAHLNDLNASLRTLEEHMERKKLPQKISQEELLSCTNFSTFLDMKLSELGMSYRDFGDLFDTGASYAQKIIHGIRANVSQEEVEIISTALSFSSIEKRYAEFLASIYADPSEEIEYAQESGNMFLAYLHHTCPETMSLELFSENPSLGRWQSSWDMYVDIGFPDNSAPALAAKMFKLDEESADLLVALNGARRSSVQKKVDRKPSVYDTTNLFDALMAKAHVAGRGINSIAAIIGRNSNYTTVVLSYEDMPRAIYLEGAISLKRFNSGKFRGLDSFELNNAFEVLKIDDVEERRHIAMLNGLIWEKHRKQRFTMFAEDEKDRPRKDSPLGKLRSEGTIQQPAYTPFHDILTPEAMRTAKRTVSNDNGPIVDVQANVLG